MRGNREEMGRTGYQESLAKKGKREQESPGLKGSPETWDQKVNLGAMGCLVWTVYLACKGTRGTEGCQGKRWVLLKICLSFEEMWTKLYS